MKRDVSTLGLLVGLVTILFVGCFDSSPDFMNNDSPDPGDQDVGEVEAATNTIGRAGDTITVPGLSVVVPMNALDQDVNLVVNAIDKNTFTEFPSMVSDAFFVGLEPEVTLNLPVELQFDLAAMDAGHLVDKNALIVRKIQPGVSTIPLYVQSREGESSITYETTSLGLFAVFVSECYDLCQKKENCPAVTIEENSAMQQSISQCVEALPVVRETDTGTEQIYINCLTDMNELNSQQFQIMVDCSANHECEDAGSCCLHDPPDCGEVVTDGDLDSDDEPDSDIEDDTADTDEPDQADADEDEQDVPVYDFSPCICTSADTCGTDPCVGSECYKDSVFGLNANEGICTETPADTRELELYEWNGSTFSQASQQVPDLSCVGQEPNSLTGEDVYDLAVQLETYWSIDSLEGIHVELYLETGSNPYEGTPYATRVSDSNGRVAFNGAGEVESNRWFALRIYRAEAQGVKEIPEIWNFGYFVDGRRASEEETVEVTAHFIAAANLTALKNVYLGGEDVPNGYGMVIGQLTDCSTSAYTLANAVVGFVESRPLHLGYFNSNTTPGPTANRYTSKNGLFMGVFLPPLDSLTVFSAAHARETEGGGVAFRTVAMSPTDHVRIKPNVLSWIRFNVTNTPLDK